MNDSCRSIRLFFFLQYGFLLVVATPLCGILIFSAETLAGHLFGSLAAIILAIPILWLLRGRLPRPLTPLLIFVSLAMLAYLVLRAPSGRTHNTPVSSHYLGVDMHERYTLTNLLPEIDQVNLGISLVPWIDPFITSVQADHLHAITMPIYREMWESPDYRAMGSVMGYAYLDLFGLREDPRHLYRHVPAAKTGTALIFLHGSAGNFKSYIYVLSALAEAEQIAVLCPSFGFGNWGDKRGDAVVTRTREFAIQTLGAKQIYLAGLSQGGVGASRMAHEKFRGYIFISPVFDQDAIESEHWRDQRVIVLSGERDKRVTAQYVKTAVQELKNQGANVQHTRYPDQDHFLLYAKRQEVLSAIGQWMTLSSTTTSTLEER